MLAISRECTPSASAIAKKDRYATLFCYGGGGGIRTPVGFHPNGFQDRLVMTASIRLRVQRL